MFVIKKKDKMFDIKKKDKMFVLEREKKDKKKTFFVKFERKEHAEIVMNALTNNYIWTEI